MPTSLTADRHLEVLAAAGDELAARAERAGPSAPVPTCPAWTAEQLVAHQGTVHRWAAANLLGEDANALPSQTASLAEQPDIVAWYREGLAQLLETFAEVPDDVRAMVFLRDSPPPRAFWARRQAHEITMHAVDALAAELGRVPTADEAALDVDVAVDGIDELLGGFLIRPTGKVRSDEPYTVSVEPTDDGRAWSFTVSADPVTTRYEADPAADAVLEGTAAQLYLGLWNRGDEIVESGSVSVLEQWRQMQRVRWS